MPRRLIVLLLFVIAGLLAACQAKSTPQPAVSNPTAVSALLVVSPASSTPEPAHPVLQTLTRPFSIQTPQPPELPPPAVTVPVEPLSEISDAVLMQTRVAEEELLRQSYPTPTDGPALTPLPADAPQPYQDCQRTPGLAPCDLTAPPVVHPPLAGWLAFYDSGKSALVFADLKTGQAWQVHAPQPQFMSWSPNGTRLLVQFIHPSEKDFFRSYAVYTPQGELVEQSSKGDGIIWKWQPAGAALEIDRTYSHLQPIVHSEQGDEAWLESSSDFGRVLHVRLAGETAWKSYKLNVSPPEWSYQIYDWIPGTHHLLISSFGGSSVNFVMLGEGVFLFNAETGQLLNLHLNTHLEKGWAEWSGNLLAYIPLPYREQLGILDGRSGEISFPLPLDRIKINELSWRPGRSPEGDAIIFAVNFIGRRQNDSTPFFETKGIYAYQLQSKKLASLVKTADDWIAGNIRWTADGQWMFYDTGPFERGEQSQASLHAYRMSDGKDWVLVTGLSEPDVYVGDIGWNMTALYLPVP